jgi:tetratricopeptide (TPR) repeat protein
MRRAPLGAFVLVILCSLAAFAKDRDRDRDDDTPPTPQRNPEADKTRAEADQANQRGDYRRVIELANLLLSTYPTDNPHVAYYHRASAQVELGRQARSPKQIREGIADARQGLSVEGKKHAWLYIPYLYGLTSLAEVEKRNEHADLALQVAAPLLQRPIGADFSANDKANLLYQRALAHTVRGDLNGAIVDYTDALRLTPQFLGAHIKRAEALTAQRRTREAASAYDEAVKLFPKTVLVYNNRGNFRRSTGDLDGAIADFSRSLEFDPKFAVGYVNRGLCLTEQDNPQGGEGDFSQALKLPLDPSMQLLTHRLRALARLSQGNSKDPLADYAAALRLAPQDATLYEERGCARFFAKDFTGSADDFAKALQMNPQLTRILPWQALALARAGKSAESRAVLDSAPDAKPAPPAWILKLADCLADRITEEALLTAASEFPPQEKNARLCEARFFIGQKKLLANAAEPAAEQFREALATKAFSVTSFRGARYELGDFATR